MAYFYAILWFVVGLALIFSAAKENKIFYFAGGFFLLLGGWWLADAILEQDLFSGGWGIAMRVAAAAALAVFCVAFFRERRKTIRQAEGEKDGKKSEDKPKGSAD